MHTRTSKILRLPLVQKVNGLVNITLKHRPNWMSWTHITTRWWGTECSNTITTCKSRRTVAQTNHCNSRQWAWNSIERLWNEIWSTTWNTSPHAWTKKDPDSTSNTNSPYSLREDHWKISLSKCFDHYRQIITHTHRNHNRPIQKTGTRKPRAKNTRGLVSYVCINIFILSYGILD